MPLYLEFEQLFANTVLEREFCDEETLTQALELQKKTVAAHRDESLQDILVSMEALTARQARKIAEEIMSRLDAAPDIDGYDSLKKFGTSGIAVLYTAHQQSVDRKVVLKVLPTEDLEDSPALRRFNQEAKLRARLNHKNIVGCIDFGTTPTCCYSVLVYVQNGEFLSALLQGPRLAPATLAGYMADVTEGLRYLAKQNLVHGNVCPENILAVPGGSAWLSGFDFIAEAGAAAPIVGGAVPRFVPPEGVDRPAAAADMYALGCTLFTALCGTDPHTLPRRENAGETPPATRFSMRANHDLAAIAYTLMQADPGRRYRDFDTLLDDFRAVADRRPPRFALALPTPASRLARHIPDWPRGFMPRAALYLAATAAGVAAAWGIFCMIYGSPSGAALLPPDLASKKHWQRSPTWRGKGDEAAELWLQAGAAKESQEKRMKRYAQILQRYPKTVYGRAVTHFRLDARPGAAKP